MADENAQGQEATSKPASEGVDNAGENNVEDFTNFWQDNTAERNAKPETPQQPQQQPQQTDPNAALENYVQGLRLTDGVDYGAIAEGIAAGNMEPLQKAFEGLASNVYKRAMLDANQVIDTRVQDGVKRAVNETSGLYKTDQTVKGMHAALPFTQKPEFSVVANAVLKRALDQGQAPEAAYKTVRSYFKHLTQIGAEDLGLDIAPAQSPGRRGYGNPRNGEAEDFVALLQARDTNQQ